MIVFYSVILVVAVTIFYVLQKYDEKFRNKKLEKRDSKITLPTFTSSTLKGPNVTSVDSNTTNSSPDIKRNIPERQAVPQDHHIQPENNRMNDLCYHEKNRHSNFVEKLSFPTQNMKKTTDFLTLDKSITATSSKNTIPEKQTVPQDHHIQPESNRMNDLYYHEKNTHPNFVEKLSSPTQNMKKTTDIILTLNESVTATSSKNTIPEKQAIPSVHHVQSASNRINDLCYHGKYQHPTSGEKSSFSTQRSKKQIDNLTSNEPISATTREATEKNIPEKQAVPLGHHIQSTGNQLNDLYYHAKKANPNPIPEKQAVPLGHVQSTGNQLNDLRYHAKNVNPNPEEKSLTSTHIVNKQIDKKPENPPFKASMERKNRLQDLTKSKELLLSEIVPTKKPIVNIYEIYDRITKKKKRKK